MRDRQTARLWFVSAGGLTRFWQSSADNVAIRTGIGFLLGLVWNHRLCWALRLPFPSVDANESSRQSSFGYTTTKKLSDYSVLVCLFLGLSLQQVRSFHSLFRCFRPHIFGWRSLNYHKIHHLTPPVSKTPCSTGESLDHRAAASLIPDRWIPLMSLYVNTQPN